MQKPLISLAFANQIFIQEGLNDFWCVFFADLDSFLRGVYHRNFQHWFLIIILICLTLN